MTTRIRRYDIDWLRVFAMLTIFCFHCARFFNDEDWHVKNAQLDFGMSVFVRVLAEWIMPLFFMLSAISVYHALSQRDNRQYVGERFKRLVIPLVFGIFVIVPPQVYLERVSHLQFSGAFTDFLPYYFSGFYGFGGNFAWMGLHLWYLEFLFLFSLLTLPLFRYLSRPAIQSYILRAAPFFKTPATIFLLAIAVAIMELLINLQPQGIGRRDFGGWGPLTYLVFFILGYTVAANEMFQLQIKRQRFIALVLAVSTTSGGYFLVTSGYSDRSVCFALLRAFNSWFWLTAILGFGFTHFNFTNGLLKFANEAVLPFYILHQTVIVVFGFYMAGWALPVLLKYFILSVTSFSVIILIYGFGIRRFAAVRFLFGMKPR
jgi:peptidoglycan/LPS O-acetylase OafA/YrhL